MLWKMQLLSNQFCLTTSLSNFLRVTILTMEFVTIHDLSRELNVPARVIRYRLIHLIAEGKLKKHKGFRQDDFKDY
jgi:hypothetical protein